MGDDWNEEDTEVAVPVQVRAANIVGPTHAAHFERRGAGRASRRRCLGRGRLVGSERIDPIVRGHSSTAPTAAAA